jgi:hypothetical protein
MIDIKAIFVIIIEFVCDISSFLSPAIFSHRSTLYSSLSHLHSVPQLFIKSIDNLLPMIELD